MIVLDENIPEDQRQLLRSWRVRVHQIGDDVGRKGLKDEQILPLLRKLPFPTFVTRDFDFWDARVCHSRYCVLVLDLHPDECATFVRRILRHPFLNTKAKRMGHVVRVDQMGFELLTANEPPFRHLWDEHV